MTRYSRATDLRALFSRVVLVNNSKGGVLKTSLVSNMAGLTALGAAEALDVLIVDLDPQSNCATDFGFAQHAQEDGGETLRKSLETGSALKPFQVRERVDMVSAHKNFWKLPGFYPSRADTEPIDLLVPSLAAVADNYDLILIDTPPGDGAALRAAFGVARWVVCPVRSDAESVNGLEMVNSVMELAAETNPYIELLSVVKTQIPSSAKKLHAELDETLRLSLGEAADDLVCPFSIRDVQGPARACRDRGQLAMEVLDSQNAVPFYKYLHENKKVPSRWPSLGGLVEDYARVTQFLLERIGRLEDEEAMEENADE